MTGDNIVVNRLVRQMKQIQFPDHIQQQLTEQQRLVDELRVAINILMVQDAKVKAMINEALGIGGSPKLTDNHH